MKRIIIAIIISVLFILGLCGWKKVGHENLNMSTAVKIYEDEETGVEYIVFHVGYVKWSFGNEDADFEDKALSVFLTCIFPGIVMAILTCFAIASATDLIGWIASPTASAVKEITSMIK